MSLPTPPVDLKDHCSVLHKNTLYVYTPSKFLSLSLEEGAKWKELASGRWVTGAACTKGFFEGDTSHPVMYVVGGETDDPAYRGLQRYSFRDGKWESVHTVTEDVKDRVRHAAIALDDTSILVYAGTQVDDPNPSTQTFVISTTPPFNIQSYNSYVPPAIAPLLVPWGQGAAAMVGGGPDNKEVYKFSLPAEWEKTGASLEQPLPDRSSVQCATVSGDDGSRILQCFDMSVSPNEVSRYVLLGSGGEPAEPGRTIGGPRFSQLGNKRQLSISDYPPYNDKFAPTSTRSDFSLAQGGDGMVVISGGGGDDPITVFDQFENKWVDTTELFLGPDATSSVSSSTASSTSTSTSSESATATTSLLTTSTGTDPPALAAAPPDNSHTLMIVGATLGAVLGVAALLICILLFIAWKKKKAKYPRGKDGEQPGHKDRLSIQDQGMEPLTRSVQPMGRGPVPSTDSWAFVSGQADGNQRKAAPTTFNDFNFGTEKGRSPLRNVETTNALDKETAVTGAAVVGKDNNDKSRGERLTDEGWGKYFQGDNDKHDGGDRSLRSTISSQETKSDYGSHGWPHASAEVPPLQLKTLGGPQPLGRVASGSPSTEQAPRFDALVAQQGMTAKISSADSVSISSEGSNDNRDAFSSGVPESIHDWTPVRSPFVQEDRVASSNYSESVYYQGSNGPGASTNSDHRLTQWPDHMQSSRDSTQPQQRRNLSSDISWLNLGNNNNNNNSGR